MLQERRAQSRVRAYRPVRIHQPGNSRIIETLAKDLSEGGVCCLSPVALPIASEISIEIILSSGQEPLALHGKTAWFRIIPESEQFDLGITFSEVSPHMLRRLSGYLDHINQKLSFSTAT